MPVFDKMLRLLRAVHFLHRLHQRRLEITLLLLPRRTSLRRMRGVVLQVLLLLVTVNGGMCEVVVRRKLRQMLPGLRSRLDVRQLCNRSVLMMHWRKLHWHSIIHFRL